MKTSSCLIAAASIIAALFISACGGGSDGPGVAGGESTQPGSSDKAAQAKGRGDALAYSKCMRSHGLPSFPDPNSEGQIAIQAGPGSDLDPESPTMKAATEACKSLMAQPSPADEKRMLAGALKFAKCMRSHGVRDFPDPSPDMGPQNQKGPSEGELDPNSPQVKAAMQACQGDAPGGVQVHEQAAP